MSYYRSKFRKIVYKTTDWRINIKPVFVEELKGLLCNLYPEDVMYLKMRNFYRFYLIVYIALFACWRLS